MDLTDFKSRSDKKKVFDAMAAASIFNNSAGVDTSKARVIPLDSFCHFLEHFQKEPLGEEKAKAFIEVPVLVQADKMNYSSAGSCLELNVQ
jgi:phosphatidylinositol phospholipase C epsilon